jgi:hypothetical protein
MSLRIGAIALDCDDPAGLAAFYTALFDAAPGFTSDDFAALQVGGIWLSMHRVDDFRPPTWPSGATPKQVHLDLAVEGDDLDGAEARAIGFGARRPDGEQPAPDRWRVLLDPAGHPFCLSPATAFPS